MLQLPLLRLLLLRCALGVRSEKRGSFVLTCDFNVIKHMQFCSVDFESLFQVILQCGVDPINNWHWTAKDNFKKKLKIECLYTAIVLSQKE